MVPAGAKPGTADRRSARASGADVFMSPPGKWREVPDELGAVHLGFAVIQRRSSAASTSTPPPNKDRRSSIVPRRFLALPDAVAEHANRSLVTAETRTTQVRPAASGAPLQF